MDTFDWYSPKYQSKHSYPEVFKWFKESGLTDIEILDTPVSVKSKGVRWLRLNDRQALHLVENKKAAPAQIAHIAFNVEDVQAWKNKLEKSGVIFNSPKFSVYEADRFFILDPSQNRIEFVKWLA